MLKKNSKINIETIGLIFSIIIIAIVGIINHSLKKRYDEIKDSKIQYQELSATFISGLKNIYLDSGKKLDGNMEVIYSGKKQKLSSIIISKNTFFLRITTTQCISCIEKSLEDFKRFKVTSKIDFKSYNYLC